MKSFFRLVLLALVLLVVALVSALTAMRFVIHGREVAVPNLVDKTPAEARRIAEESGLELEVEREYYSPDVPEGKILSQLPPVGTLVRRGWGIRVAASLGPQRVHIPDVLGESERAAEMNIRRRGLDVSAVAEVPSPTAPGGQVLAQSPPANANGVSAPMISLLVADPAPPQAFVMPNFIGQPLDTVKLIVQGSGLRVGTVSEARTVASPEVPAPSGTAPLPASAPSSASLIVSQNPGPGEKVLAGAAVNFEVR